MSDEIKLLREELERLKKDIFEKDKAAYDELTSVLGAALLETQAIQAEYEKTVKLLGIQKLIGIISNACIPTSDTIGFKFVDVVQTAAKDTLAKGLPDGKDDVKGRFLSVLTKVVQNPLAKIAIGSSPFGGMISSAIDMASSFFQTKLDSGGALGKAYVATKDVISQEIIKEFSSKLHVYIEFYEKLADANKTFVFKLDGIKLKNESLKVALTDYHQKYRSALGLVPDENGDITRAYFEIITKPVDQNGAPKFQEIMKKPQIKNAEPIARSAPNFKSDVKTFSREVAGALHTFLESFISVVESAKTWENTIIDKQKLQNLINSLLEYQQLAILVEFSPFEKSEMSLPPVYWPNLNFDIAKLALFEANLDLTN